MTSHSGTRSYTTADEDQTVEITNWDVENDHSTHACLTVQEGDNVNRPCDEEYPSVCITRKCSTLIHFCGEENARVCIP